MGDSHGKSFIGGDNRGYDPTSMELLYLQL